MAEHPQWRFTPEASLPLTILHSLPDGFTAVTLPAPWVMPADAVLWIQSTRSAWQPGPAHVFESDLPVRHETQQTQDPAEPAARAKGAGAQTKPASRSRVVERIPLAADLPGLF